MYDNLQNGNYRERLNALITKTTNDWFNSMSKEDLLDFLRETETITADFLRTILRNEGVVIMGGYSFATAEERSTVNFNGDPNNTPGVYVPDTDEEDSVAEG